MSPVHGLGDGLRYGLLGLPLAFCALPLYVVMPHFYATQWGVSLSVLGGLLLALRALDALIDPWIGRWCDAWAHQGILRLWSAMALAAVVLALAFAALFHPLVDASHAVAWAGGCLALTYLAYSLVTVGHQSWGARLGGDARGRSTVVAWREGLGLLGVVLASTVPALWGASSLGWVMAPLLLLGMGALRWAPRPPTLPRTDAASAVADQDLWLPWRNPAFVRLVAVFALNGIASAVPATLVLFFIEDRLQVAGHWQGVFLGLYFLSAALSMPLWLRVVARVGLEQSWLMGMVLSVAAFVGAAAVGTGDVLLYGVVCVASGLALGSDLAIPAALLAQVAQRSDAPDSASAQGVYFGWWNLVTKLNLALAAGLTLPLLAALGYTPGSRTAAPLAMLTAVYCLLPCALKALAGAALYGFFVRPSERLPHAT
ncbi:MFS transporter [Curvibacter sp. APW13]|uniref:MFS transporter n=1 Tax=Curvibacter sp. APW13 TaxID=3077236 RepID=UPI0028E04E26|nr:MFS transporter [Curvibacter sp. APW13]MDT8990418.1 MFS transporter [Curvibacter sp. APW13]